MSGLRVSLIHPPSPPGLNIARDFSGGYGTAIPSSRDRYGTDPGYMSVPYVSLLYTASLLEIAGHTVQFIDGQAQDLAAEDVCAAVAAFTPSVIVGVMSLPSTGPDIELYQLLRGRFDAAFFCAIGTVCRALPREVLDGRTFDAAVCADPEVVLPDLCDALATGSNWREVAGITYLEEGVVSSSAALPRLNSLDTPSVPAYHLAPMQSYTHRVFREPGRYALVLSAKGCPHKCAYYCPYPYGFGRRTVFRSPESVVGEIAMLARDYGVSAVIFRDQDFAISRTHAEAVCDGLAGLDLGVEWMCETRFDSVDSALLRKMELAGCRQINFGLESADPSVLHLIGKPGCTLEQARSAIRMTREAGIGIHLHTIVGWPDDDHTTAHKWVRLLKRLGPDRVGVSVLTPYPGTALRAQAMKEGLLETSDWSRYTCFTPVMRTRHLTTSEVAEVRRQVLQEWSEPMLIARAANKARAVAVGVLRRNGGDGCRESDND